MKLPQEYQIRTNETLCFSVSPQAQMEEIEALSKSLCDRGIKHFFIPESITLVNRPISESFETWYEQEGKDFKNHKEACRIAWENGAYKQLNNRTK